MSDGGLDEAYPRIHRTGPEFGGNEHGENAAANHAAMGAEVLSRRGRPELVTGWLDRYVTRLRPMPDPTDPVTDANWQDALGDGRRVADWVAYLGRAVTEQPWDRLLAAWWPRLLPGVTAGATHGVIRTAHAVRTLRRAESAASRAELAHGLAYWAARWRPLPGAVPATAGGDHAAGPALDAVPRLADRSGVIAARLPRLARLPGWAAAQRRLRVPDDPDAAAATLAALVDAAVERWPAHAPASPVLLVHTVTAPNAFRVLLPSLPREAWAPAVRVAWSATAAILAMYADPRPAPPDRLPAPTDAADPVAEVLDRAAADGDEHVLKFTDAAVESYERTGDPRTLGVALHAVDVLGHP